MMKLITEELLDTVTSQAKENSRLRMNYNFHASMDAPIHRLLNALEPGTVLPIHRHRKTSETVAILRGRAVQYLYDDNGCETDSVLLEAGGEVPAMQVEMGQWHRLEALESGTVIVEFKNGAYEPIGPEDIL